MLPIVLVLFVAHCAFGAPAVSVKTVPFNEVGASGPFDIIDGGDMNMNSVYMRDIVTDLMSANDPIAQAIGVAQAIAILAEHATGVPGDACAAASAIEGYTNAISTGNVAAANAAGAAYLGSLLNSIDLITELSANPAGVRYSSGPRGNCAGGGRTYNIDGAWEAILATASPAASGLIAEEYGAAKRLYCAVSTRSNNVGAAVTAAALPPVSGVMRQVIGPASSFLSAALGGNAGAAGAQLKRAIQQIA